MAIRKLTTVLAACVLLAATTAAAGPMKWWQDEKFKAELRLTPDQSSRIEEIFQASFPKLRAAYEELNRREEQLSNLISGPDISEADVLRQADQVELVRAELSKGRTLMLFRMRRVLSPEQRLRLQALQKDRDQQRQPSRDHDNDRPRRP